MRQIVSTFYHNAFLILAEDKYIQDEKRKRLGVYLIKRLVRNNYSEEELADLYICSYLLKLKLVRRYGNTLCDRNLGFCYESNTIWQ